MSELGKYSSHGRDFYLEEYKSLRREVERLAESNRVLERNVLIAVALAWGWLFERRSHLPSWTWFIPVIFWILGYIRSFGINRSLSTLHLYVGKLETAFSNLDDPGGREHDREDKTPCTPLDGHYKRFLAPSSNAFWGALFAITVVVAFYEIYAGPTVSRWRDSQVSPQVSGYVQQLPREATKPDFYARKDTLKVNGDVIIGNWIPNGSTAACTSQNNAALILSSIDHFDDLGRCSNGSSLVKAVLNS